MYETINLAEQSGSVVFILRNLRNVTGYGLHVSSDTGPGANPGDKGPSTSPEFAFMAGTVQYPSNDLVFRLWQGDNTFRVDLGSKREISYIKVTLSRKFLKVEATRHSTYGAWPYNIVGNIPILDDGLVNNFWGKNKLFYTENGVISGKKDRRGINYQVVFAEHIARPGLGEVGESGPDSPNDMDHKPPPPI